MSDVTISIDANTSGAEAKAKRLKDALDGTGKSWAQSASQTLSRVGGDAGGGLGRLLGGVAGGFSMVAAAAAVAGLGINAYLGFSARAVDAAREQVTWQQRLADAIKQSGQARQDLAAGGASQVAGMRRLLARGGTESAVKRLEQEGFAREDAVQAAGTLRLDDWTSASERSAIALARTGEMSLAEAAKRIAAFGNRTPTQEQVARQLVDARGEKLTPSTLQAAMLDLSRGGNGNDTMSDAVRASNRVLDVQAADLMSGATAQAINERADYTLDPRARALEKVREEAAKTEESLRAAANAQGKIAAALATLGQLVGGDGSELDKLARFQQNTPAFRQ